MKLCGKYSGIRSSSANFWPEYWMEMNGLFHALVTLFPGTTAVCVPFSKSRCRIYLYRPQ
jgi:hypothetical protein